MTYRSPAGELKRWLVHIWSRIAKVLKGALRRASRVRGVSVA